MLRPVGDDEVRVWAERDGPIMLRAVSASGDPVELNEEQARRIADALLSLVAMVQRGD